MCLPVYPLLGWEKNMDILRLPQILKMTIFFISLNAVENDSGWLYPFESVETYTASVRWSKRGNYQIRV